MDLVAVQRGPRGGAASCPARTRCRRRAGRGPSTPPAPDSTGSSMRRHSIWNPPQMPSTGLPVRGVRGDAVGQSAVAQPAPGRRRSPCCRGSPRRRRRRRSAGSVTQRTSTPGSQASASTSVEFEMRGSRIAATRSHCRAARRLRIADDAVCEHRHRILGVEPQPVGVRDDAVGGPAGQCRPAASAPARAGRGRRGTC